VYPDYKSYFDMFLITGGVIEAMPECHYENVL